MSNIIAGNMVGGTAPLRTLIITDADGNEFVGVVTENAQVFDASPSDVRINKTFVSDNGIGVGENTITYRTTEGSELIMPGSEFIITGLHEYNKYNYTKMQCVIAKYVSSTDKTAIEKIVLNDNVYNVGSSAVISNIEKDAELKTVKLNITNNTDSVYIIYFFTYAEEES